MTCFTLAEAAATLPEIVHRLTRGEEVSLVENGHVVARIVGEQPVPWQRPGPGLLKHMMTVIADDDEHLADFKEYME
jgi:antitoxin (DNA-binding transcriptional repressor) of toxin-antitoxin stability system